MEVVRSGTNRVALEPNLEKQVGVVPALEGLHASVPIPGPDAGFWKQWRAFVGPAFLVSVGYMDPGNWASDLQAGAQFKYQLLWVVGLSSLMAIVMQVLSARLGIVTGKDLARACRDYYPAWSRWPMWLLCETAIAACDLAEVLGSAVAINLLFGIPLFTAVLITAVDVFLLLMLERLGMRLIEAVILTLVITIAGCYFVEIFVLPELQPSFWELGAALIHPRLDNHEMLFLAIAIIGATVMPHNLYLHSALVQSRQLRTDRAAVKRAIKFNTIDTILALSVALLINAAILVLAGLVFHGQESVQREADLNNEDWIRVAYLTLSPLLGTSLASVLFAVSLLASGQSSTITGTLAGQVVMEGFLHWRVRPWVRRLITRSLAIFPAVLIIGLQKEFSVTEMINWTQVVLALQLPFAMFPLLHFTSSSRIMGRHANGWFMLVAGWSSGVLITALAGYGICHTLVEFFAD